MKLVRRRTLWWPTAWGWLAIVAVLAALATIAFRQAAAFLAVDDPARRVDGRGARILVVEGWLDPAELDQAVARARSGGYDLVLTSGGPFDGWDVGQRWPTFADRSADYLKRQGLGDVALSAVPSPLVARERSFVSALAVRDWLANAGRQGEAIDVFSAGVHARRSRLIYRLAMGSDAAVGVLAARPGGYDIERWWATSTGAKTVAEEAVGLAWTSCCFSPASRPAAKPPPAAQG